LRQCTVEGVEKDGTTLCASVAAASSRSLQASKVVKERGVVLAGYWAFGVEKVDVESDFVCLAEGLVYSSGDLAGVWLADVS